MKNPKAKESLCGYQVDYFFVLKERMAAIVTVVTIGRYVTMKGSWAISSSNKSSMKKMITPAHIMISCFLFIHNKIQYFGRGCNQTMFTKSQTLGIERLRRMSGGVCIGHACVRRSW